MFHSKSELGNKSRSLAELCNNLRIVFELRGRMHLWKKGKLEINLWTLFSLLPGKSEGVQFLMKKKG